MPLSTSRKIEEKWWNLKENHENENQLLRLSCCIFCENLPVDALVTHVGSIYWKDNK